MKNYYRSIITILLISVFFYDVGASAKEDLSAIKVEPAARHVSCHGHNDGSISLSVSGGVAPYSFSWLHGANTKDVKDLKAGLYTVTVQDAQGNTANACIELVQPSALKVRINGTELLCEGASTKITAAASGGKAPYSFTWAHGGNEASTSVSPGTYKVVVKDANGCTANDEFTIRSGGGIVAELKKGDVKCNGDLTGTLEVVSPDNAQLRFLWSTGATTQKVQGLKAGTYWVEVSDNSGCINKLEATIKEAAPITINTEVKLENCNGAMIDATVTGGTAPYKYYWSNGARTEDVSGLNNGFYLLSVTDDVGCVRSHSVSVNNVSKMGISSRVKDVACGKDTDGEVNLTVTGGTAPYTFVWSNGATSEDITGLSAGQYTVVVSDARACVDSHTVVVGKAQPFTLDAHVKNISCRNSNDGQIELVVEGAVGEVQYKWSNGAESYILGPLPEGTYWVEVSDESGCSRYMEFTLLNPQALDVDLHVVEDECFGGSIRVDATGGSQPYVYEWAHGASDRELNGLASGFYKVVIKDASGCKDSSAAEINVGALTTLKMHATDVSCAGSQDGKARVEVLGDNRPYSILWQNGAQSDEISGLAKGSYQVQVKDAKSCTYSATATVGEAARLQVHLFKSEPTCADASNGVLRTLVSGGKAPYTYSWSNGSTSDIVSGLGAGRYQVTVTDAAACSMPASEELKAPTAVNVTLEAVASCGGSYIRAIASGGAGGYSYEWSNGSRSEMISDVAPGQYNVTVWDKNACNASASVILKAYEAPKAEIMEEGNTLKAIASAGTAPYSYTWSTGDTGQVITGVVPGVYELVVKDANGCSVETSYTVETRDVKGLSATIDCCQDMQICKGETARIPVHFTGNAPYVLSYMEGNVLRTVTTYDNPYYITVAPTKTTIFTLVSVGNGCSSGPVCGKATVAVNDCGGKCGTSCFSAEVVDVFAQGNCREITLRIVNNGHCRNGLSHLSVSVPCGEVGKVHNTRGFKVVRGTDPTSGINGFKIDDMKNFGERKNGVEESFMVTYTVCNKSDECESDYCAPLIAYKASTCVYYQKAVDRWDGFITSNLDAQESMMSVYPNPLNNGGELKVELKGGFASESEFMLVDARGQQVFHQTAVVGPQAPATLKIGSGLPQGVYLLIVRKDGQQMSKKITIP